MRNSSVVVGACVTALAAISLGGCAASAAGPSLRDTTPVASVSASATSSPDDVVHFDLPSLSSVVDAPAASASPVPPSVAPITSGTQSATRIQVGVPVAPRWFAADGQSLWVHEPVGLVRVDLATSMVTGQFPLDWMEYGYVATGAGAVWQTDYQHNALLRIDPVNGKVVASIPVGLQPLGVVVTAGSVWVADEHSEAVTRVDPTTNRVVATITIGQPGPAGPQIITAGPGGVWVDVPNMGEVVRIDAATNSVGLRLPLDGVVASDGKQVWIAGPNGTPEVVRVDPVSGKVITVVNLDTVPGGLAVGLGSAWVLADGLTRIDEATGRIVRRLDIGDAGGNVTVAGGAVWVTADGQPYVVRISPK